MDSISIFCYCSSHSPMKKYFFLLALSFIAFILPAQEAPTGGELKGTVKDASTGETIIGATVLAAEGKGTVTDASGNYSIRLDNGEYTVTISSLGYTAQKAKVKIAGKTVTKDFTLEGEVLGEVEVVADIAKVRETPVAISTISQLKIKEELASRDIPMVLNSTPGVYATEQGGGSGDARISIRGFDQRNIAVLVDGVPVNDMENGQVFWSNWDGLGEVTKTMQVQRGLGASKLAIPSVGGTMNIITRGIDDKRSYSLKQEVGSDGYLKTGLSINSGQLKHGFGVTAAGTYKKGNGFADQTWTEAWSYFFKVQKRIGTNQTLSFSVNGAPQKHGQRTDMLPIAIYNKEFAQNVIAQTSDSSLNDAETNALVNSGLNYEDYTTLTQGSRGPRYNPHWGTLDRWTIENGDTIHDRQDINTKVNFFHKPQFNLSHFWNVSDKVYISTVAYLSIGHGGGTNISSSTGRDTLTGKLILQPFYNSNHTNIDPSFSPTEHKSSRYIYASMNDHFWYGVLSSAIIKPNKNLDITTGIDGRYYKGTHYREIYDLLGGDYLVNYDNQNAPFDKPSGMKRAGDKVYNYYEGIVMWGGVFAQAEYRVQKWSTFLTLTGSETGYQRIDYFRKKDVVLDDTTFVQAVDYNDTLRYNGNAYTTNSPEARFSTSERKWFPGITIKGGANYNINEHQNVYGNAGYLTMAPKFGTVFDNRNQVQQRGAVKLQKVVAFELGYGIKYQKFASNLNLYHTTWKNKPITTFSTIRIAGDDYYYDVNGLDAIHSGAELDLVYKPLKKLEFEAITSIGDWVVNSSDSVYLYEENGDPAGTIDFSAKGVHVGDAAQIQYGGSVRYEPIRHGYLKARVTVFDKNYANYDLLNLSGANKDRESWKMPAYSQLEFHAGYEFEYRKLKFSLTGSLLNALNTVYISDARNGTNYDAASALVFIGQGRRFVSSLRITF
jgi:iron complex outermembrane receptor protein